MNTASWIKLVGAVGGTMIALDLLWLGVLAKGFYGRELASLLRPDVRWAPALLFYVIYVAAIIVFAALPALEKQSLVRAIALGAFLGFAAYAAYDLTSLALIRDFPVKVAVVDMAWGALITATAATAGYLAAR
jgi:uncharacterized membrane protein